VDLVCRAAHDRDRARKLGAKVGQRRGGGNHPAGDGPVAAGVHGLDATAVPQRWNRVVQTNKADRAAGMRAPQESAEGGGELTDAGLDLQANARERVAQVARALFLRVAKLRVRVYEAHHLADQRRPRLDRGKHVAVRDHVVSTTFVASRASKAR
jgi:hypothetical protein